MLKPNSILFSVLLAAAVRAAGGPDETSVRIGKERQLFLDDFLIAQTSNVTRRVCAVTKWPGNPVIRREADWEPIRYLLFGSVLYDEQEKLYKAWCDGRGAVYYFTSTDGIQWERPRLNLFPVAGQPTHQVVLAGTNQTVKGWCYFLEHFGVTKDTRDLDAARRYKMGYLYLERNYRGPGASPFHSNERRGLGVAFSPDGIHWTPMDEPATCATRDGQTHWMFDETRSRYVLYGRTKHIAPEVLERYGSDPNFKHHWGRAVARAESSDFVHWTPNEGQLILSSDTKDGPMDEIYSLNVFPYEDIYIGLVQVFHNYPDRVWLDIQLAVSRDGVRFERLSDRSPFIPVGGVGAWDRFNNSVANSRPIAVGDELRFYYSGRNVVHGSPFRQSDDGKRAGVPYQGAIGFGTIKRDRFAGMEATFSAGTLRTKPLIFEGQRLHVNAAVKFGSLTVALLDAEGKRIERAAIEGQDAADVAVPLAKLGSLSGKPVRLEFTINNGHLYSFWCTEAAAHYREY